VHHAGAAIGHAGHVIAVDLNRVDEQRPFGQQPGRVSNAMGERLCGDGNTTAAVRLQRPSLREEAGFSGAFGDVNRHRQLIGSRKLRHPTEQWRRNRIGRMRRDTGLHELRITHAERVHRGMNACMDASARAGSGPNTSRYAMRAHRSSRMAASGAPDLSYQRTVIPLRSPSSMPAHGSCNIRHKAVAPR
jgi:hypothetical protein